MDVDIGGSAEQKEGGVRMNLIPKEGGNTFGGMFYFGYANTSMEGSNFTQELQDRGRDTELAQGIPGHQSEFWWSHQA
jgi:hypothetical protein